MHNRKKIKNNFHHNGWISKTILGGGLIFHPLSVKALVKL